MKRTILLLFLITFFLISCSKDSYNIHSESPLKSQNEESIKQEEVKPSEPPPAKNIEPPNQVQATPNVKKNDKILTDLFTVQGVKALPKERFEVFDVREPKWPYLKQNTYKNGSYAWFWRGMPYVINYSLDKELYDYYYNMKRVEDPELESCFFKIRDYEIDYIDCLYKCTDDFGEKVSPQLNNCFDDCNSEYERTINLTEDYDYCENLTIKFYNNTNSDDEFVMYSKFVIDEKDDPIINGLTIQFEELANTTNLNEMMKIDLINNFVQSFDYIADAYIIKSPYELLYDRKGDCEDSSILLASILYSMGYKVAFMRFIDKNHQQAGHIGVGIGCDPSLYADMFQFGQDNYCFIETTDPLWKIGKLPSSMQNQRWETKIYKIA